jgi:DNA invertase Pin-like site-specific DNA recombinase
MSGSEAAWHSSDDAERADDDRRPVVLGYASVCSERGERANSELQRQVDEIGQECDRCRLRLLEVVRERERPHERPLDRSGLGYALGRIAAGTASGLVVLDLHHVSQSLAELGRVLDWLCYRGSRFIAVAPGLDTSEDAGSLVIRTIIEVSRWERQRLVERTRIGMRSARRKGPASVADYPQLTVRIAAMRAEGMTLQGIADQLNAERIPTVRGGAKWRPSSVQAAAGYQRPPAGYALDVRPREPKYPHAEPKDV